MYRATVMKIDVTVTMIIMIIIQLEAKMDIDMAMVRMIPGDMPGRAVDARMDEHPITQLGTEIKI